VPHFNAGITDWLAASFCGQSGGAIQLQGVVQQILEFNSIHSVADNAHYNHTQYSNPSNGSNIHSNVTHSCDWHWLASTRKWSAPRQGCCGFNTLQKTAWSFTIFYYFVYHKTWLLM